MAKHFILFTTILAAIGCSGSYQSRMESASQISGSTPASGVSPTPSPTTQASPCPMGTSYQDGCSGAPAGSPLYANLFASYHGIRPPWNVAGVDYAIGVPGITLKDPTAAGTLPSCSAYDSSAHNIQVNGDNCILDSFDFTKGGGLQILIPAGVSGTILSNDLFGLSGNPPPATGLIDRRGGDLTVTYSTFQGAGFLPYFDTGASGTVTFEYDYFYDIDGDAMDFGSTQTVIVQYDACVKIGMLAGTHPDCVQFCGGDLNPASHESYVLSYQPVGVVTTGAEGVQTSQQCGGTINGFLVDHNTIIAPDSNSLTMSASIAVDDNVDVENNYIDASGAFYPFYPAGNGACFGNIALTSGSEYSGGTTYTYAAGAAIVGTFGTLTCATN